MHSFLLNILYIISFILMYREKYVELTKCDYTGKSHSSSDPAKTDSVTQLFQTLQDLEAAHDSFLSDFPSIADQEKKYLLEL
ncbi:hypothetical protein AB205_0001750 [Aquarana catesbeiana]|uniref:Uncharacterized protein n=1 Tax=Aquarana catesbeiana TaxID=8400 RepID=A0A2G9S5Y7_AQUCT|nr:hypothetical protein AB205_0001750 [Aquarana catesbeiana]